MLADVFSPSASIGRPLCDPRRAMRGILWVLDTGSPLRDLPEEFGTLKTAWRMLDHCNDDGNLDETSHFPAQHTTRFDDEDTLELSEHDGLIRR